MVIAITRSGYIKRLPVSAYREQRRGGGVGVMGMDLKDEDYIEHLFVASTHDYVLFFSTVGKVYRLKVHERSRSARASRRGGAIVNLLPFRQDEQVKAVIATRDFKEAKYLVRDEEGRRQEDGVPRLQHAAEVDGIIAIKMREDDELVGVRLSDGDDDILMVSRGGQAIRFHESEVRGMAVDASGVRGMNLRGDDEVIEVDMARDDTDLLVVTENGFGKRTPVRDYPVKGAAASASRPSSSPRHAASSPARASSATATR